MLLYGSETWAVTRQTLARIRRNDRAMARWALNAKPDQHIPDDVLLDSLQIPPIERLLQRNRLRWYGHVQRSDGWCSKCRQVRVRNIKGPGRPKKTWDETIRRDREEWQLHRVDPTDRLAWKGVLRRILPRPTPRRENVT